MKHIKRDWEFLLESGQIAVNEYLTTELIRLKRELSATPEEKAQSLPYRYWSMFATFVSDTGVGEEVANLDGPSDVKRLESEEPQIYQRFAKYLYDKIEDMSLPTRVSNYPSWRFFDSEPQVVKNQWLIHFTSDAKAIAKEGFKWGVDDPGKLGITTWLEQSDKERGGYNFAFLLSDFLDYYTTSTAYGPMPMYGNQAVLFRASGISTWHEEDSQRQVIFYGRNARDIVPIVGGNQAGRGYWTVIDKNGREKFADDDLQKVSDWVINHYPQYRKNIGPRR